jgi:hypothetical protein
VGSEDGLRGSKLAELGSGEMMSARPRPARDCAERVSRPGAVECVDGA